MAKEKIAKESLKTLLHRVCGYSNAKGSCPISLIQEILSFFPEKIGLHLSERQLTTGYNGLAGIGGQGIVICCHDIGNKKVALKIVRPVLQQAYRISENMRDYTPSLIIPDHRFIESAKLQYSVEEEAVKEIRTFVIPRVYFVEEAPIPYMLMAWVDGLSALATINSQNDFIYSLESFKKVLDAAIFLHSYNLVYRDFKHANLMITDEEKIGLLDFGLAKEIDSRNLTMTGTALGTMPYASIDMMRGAERADQSSDIHALGFVFWEFVTMSECPDYEGVATKADDREKYRFKIARKLPDYCKKIFFDATSNDDSRRFPTAEDFKNAVENLINRARSESKRQNFIATEISQGNLAVPEPPRPLAPPPKAKEPGKKFKGLTSKFLPASFEPATEPAAAKETDSEIFKRAIAEKKKAIGAFNCSKVCAFPGGCNGSGMCKKLLIAQIDTFEDIFLN